jgi:hypothetical protein
MSRAIVFSAPFDSPLAAFRDPGSLMTGQSMDRLMEIRRICLVVTISLAPSTMTAQGRGGHGRPSDGHGHTIGRTGTAAPKTAGGGDHRAGRSPTRRRGGSIVAGPLLIDSNEINPDPEDVTPPRLAPSGPQVESSSIQPPFQPTATTGAARGSLRGSLWLDVEPNGAQVYVDGFYHGTVADCQRSPAGLNLATGWHRLEFRAPGFETPAINVTVETNRTTRYQGTLKPARP